MKTLLYLASGTFKEEYLNLPFDRMIFVDKCQSFAKDYPKNNKKIRFIAKDALDAIDILKREKIKVDCLVSINEGLGEGGGDYAIFSDFLIGFLSPILKNEFTVITDVNYYQAFRMARHLGRMDWAWEKRRLEIGEEGYISPSIFSSYNTQGKHKPFGQVFKIKKNNRLKKTFVLNNITVNIIHGSIWEDEAQLDQLFLRFNPNNHIKVTRFFNKKNKISHIGDQPITHVIENAVANNYCNIGLIPWNNGNYKDFFKGLKDLMFQGELNINLYHLNKTDFSDLYNYGE